MVKQLILSMHQIKGNNFWTNRKSKQSSIFHIGRIWYLAMLLCELLMVTLEPLFSYFGDICLVHRLSYYSCGKIILGKNTPNNLVRSERSFDIIICNIIMTHYVFIKINCVCWLCKRFKKIAHIKTQSTWCFFVFKWKKICWYCLLTLDTFDSDLNLRLLL